MKKHIITNGVGGYAENQGKPNSTPTIFPEFDSRNINHLKMQPTAGFNPNFPNKFP